MPVGRETELSRARRLLDREIPTEPSLSAKTVEYHLPNTFGEDLANTFGKLHIPSRAELARIAASDASLRSLLRPCLAPPSAVPATKRHSDSGSERRH